MAKTREEIKIEANIVAQALSSFVIEVCDGKRTSDRDVMAMPEAAKQYTELIRFISLP